MHVLIMTLGSRGDVQPYLALGRELRKRGHEVTLSTGRGFEAMIEAAGLQAAPLSDDVRDLLQTPEIRAALRSFSGKIRAWRAFRGLARRQLDEMADIALTLRPDLIVYHPKALAGPSLAEVLGVPAIPSYLQPVYVPTGAYANPILPFESVGRLGNRLSHLAIRGIVTLATSGQIRAWRREKLSLQDKAPAHVLDGYAPDGGLVPRLHAHSRHIVPRPEDWGPREKVTGYWFTAPTRDWRPPRELMRFLEAKPPPVYVGFGSLPTEDARRTSETVVEALRRVGQRGVLATGWGGLAALGAAEDIHFLETAPHDWLFPRCSAVVHHGGAGTTHEGLRWGRPSVVCPVFGDQPFWGRRVQALGAGPPPLPQKGLTAAALAEALRLTETREVGKRAAELGRRLREEPGAAAAAEVIERIPAGRGHLAAV